jgi:hypothetical protein
MNSPADVDRPGRRDARRFALDLAILVGRPASLVVLAHPVWGGEWARASAGPAPPADGDALLRLVLPTEPTVCDMARVHDGGLRHLASMWDTRRLLVVPCVFGNDLVAVAVAPVPGHSDGRGLAAAARCQAERFAARLTAHRLFGAVPALSIAS